MNKRYILLIAIALFMGSCKDYLEEEVSGTLTTSVYDTPDGIQLGLNAAYSTLPNVMSEGDGQRESGWALITLGTDICTNGKDGGIRNFDKYNEFIEPANSYTTAVWDEFYVGINTANSVIAHASTALANNEEEAKNVEGQARYLRAYFYYWMVRQFGAIHYTEEETTAPETEANRTPVEEIYKEIVEDLEYAVNNLPESSVMGKANSWVAKTTLADVYLAMKEYDKAAELAEDVIINGPYSLLPNYADMWILGNENNSEFIWSAQFTNDILIDAGGNPAHMFFLSSYDKAEFMTRDIENGRPWQRFRPTKYLLELFDDEDTRYDGTFKTVWYANDQDDIDEVLAERGETIAYGDTALWMPKNPMPDEIRDTYLIGVEGLSGRDYMVRQIVNPDEYNDRVYPSTNKWIQPDRPDKNSVEGSRDFIVYRFAEVYLIAAEANALKANPDQTKALKYLNEVRLRAYNKTSVSELPVIDHVDLEVILEERAKEFAQEGKRWFDLTTRGLLVERVRMYGGATDNIPNYSSRTTTEGSVNIQDYHALRPIPQTQIDRTTNEYAQNPGY